MRIGVFGGSFDPVHSAHLILAENARDQLGLDQVWFIPTARHPLKNRRALTAFERRLEMLQFATAGNPAFLINDLERDRPGFSYTADTLDLLAAQHPGHSWHLLLGSDTLPEFPRWHQPERIVRAAELGIMARPEAPVPSAEELARSIGLADAALVRLRRIDVPLIEISSSEIRRRVAAGRSIRYLLPRAVEVYLQEKQLYRDEAG